MNPPARQRRDLLRLLLLDVQIQALIWATCNLITEVGAHAVEMRSAQGYWGAVVTKWDACRFEPAEGCRRRLVFCQSVRSSQPHPVIQCPSVAPAIACALRMHLPRQGQRRSLWVTIASEAGVLVGRGCWQSYVGAIGRHAQVRWQPKRV